MSLSDTGIISAVDDCVNLFQWTTSAIPSLHSGLSGSQQQSLQEHVLRLQGGLQRLRDALPAVYDLIDRAERTSHDTRVLKLLPGLNDTVYEIEDLLDEAKWYELKAQVEAKWSRTQSPPPPLVEFIVQGSSFSNLSHVQSRLNNLSSQLEIVGLAEATKHVDRLVKPNTVHWPYEGLFFCYYKELAQVTGFSTGSKHKRATSLANASTSASANNQFINGSRRISSLPVLVIQGTGGVGKTTLARRIWFNQTGKPRIIWIHVSDEFDVKRLTKKAIQLCTGEETTTDDLDSLQRHLSKHVSNKRLLVFLDDMRDDALKENGQCWKRFCAPFRNVRGGSMIVVTTRCSEVTEGVRTMEPIILDGLKGDVFWDFFKLCVFGNGRSEIDPELERIGRIILPKLKGSPLAARTLGCVLRMDLQASHWNSILESELWELRQEEADIFPALQLSYMHLPFYLKRCFAFCCVYPKDYKFQKARLAEVWVAEGFVESQDIGCQYFEDLVTRSFFQMVCTSGYVIPDLLHDLAQKVSEHDCFILRNYSCFDKVPQDVRHLYVLPSSDLDGSNLLRLCRYTKLRTLICTKSLGKEAGFVMGHWCIKLSRMRVISCASTDELPASIGNLKHLRYLEISRDCALKRIPSTFRWLYNLQIFYAKKCKLESLPSDFGNLINLQKFESDGLPYYPGCRVRVNAADGQGQRIVRLMKNLNQFHGLEITHVGMLTKDDAVESKLKNKKDLDELKLKFKSDGLPISSWFSRYPESQFIQDNEIDMLHQSQITQDNEMEVLQAMQPPISLKSLFLQNYTGVSLPSWFRPQNIPSLESLTLKDCFGLKSISLCMISQIIGLNLIPAVLVHSNNDSVGMFLSLTDLDIYGCRNLSSLEHFLLPKYVPAMKKITIGGCKRLESIPTEMFGDFHFLEELYMYSCPNIRSRRLVSPSLKKLRLSGCALFCSIECCSLAYFDLSSEFVMSIQLQMWSLPALRELRIQCRSLTSIGGSTDLSLCTGSGSIRAFSSLSVLSVSCCDELPTLDGLLTEEYLPAIEEIGISFCGELLSLPGERFGSFPYLKHLRIDNCRSLNWQRGLVLPPSLQRLSLHYCGDMFSSVPSCLKNLTSLVSLRMKGCQGIKCIPGDIWRCNLTSLELLEIYCCPDLVSIGGAKAVEKIKGVSICGCPNLKGVAGIMRRCSKW